MRRKPKLVIPECTSETQEKMSEGMLLRELMRTLGFGDRTKLLPIEDKDDFLRKLERIQEPYLHIPAHGDFDLTKGTRINLPPRSIGRGAVAGDHFQMPLHRSLKHKLVPEPT